MTLPLWLKLLLIVAGTFVSEDLTSITTGLLIRHGALPLLAGVAGCFAGIYGGDLALWLLGRWGLQRLLRRRWLAARLPLRRLEQLGAWFDRHAGWAILAARFLPGTRLPLYVAAGALGRKTGRFVFWTFVAAAVWTPLVVLLVAAVGERAVLPLQAYLGYGWLSFPAAVAAGYVLLRLLDKLVTPAGRARLQVQIARLWRWEFWPAWLFYLPVLGWIGLLMLRYRSLSTITVANPAIPLGGFVGESKYAILRRLPAQYIVPTRLLPAGPDAVRMRQLRHTMQDEGWAWPIILKPDVGQRGQGVKLVPDPDSAAAYLHNNPAEVIAQVYHPGPYEAGIFYYRLPGTEHGQIFSITDKQFPQVVGDGVHTLAELIRRHPRYRMQAGVFLARHAGRTDQVLPPGRTLRLAMAGNHCQGTLFCDGAHLASRELEQRIDAIARHCPGFYFGRFDVRYTAADLLRRGAGFAIVELNGITSESTNIYDPNRSLLWAYRTLFQQWSLLFRISHLNRQRGHQPNTLGEMWQALRAHYRQRPAWVPAD